MPRGWTAASTTAAAAGRAGGCGPPMPPARRSISRAARGRPARWCISRSGPIPWRTDPMTIAKFLLAALGGGLVIWLLLHLNGAAVLDAFGHAGWGGFALVLGGGLLLTFCLSSGL